MRVLLDENVDRRLRGLFDPDFEVVTVTERGWSGIRNGELLVLAESEFEALVTMDRNLQHQQQLERFDLIYVLITAPSNSRRIIEPVMAEVNRALREGAPGELQVVTAFQR